MREIPLSSLAADRDGTVSAAVQRDLDNMAGPQRVSVATFQSAI